MEHQRPPTIDPVAAGRWARQPAPVSPWLHEEVGRRMAERLEWIRQQPMAWAHWGAARGGRDVHGALRARYPQANCYLVEALPVLAQQMVGAEQPAWWRPRRWTQAPQTAGLPPDGGVQMVWSNMQLHHVADPQAMIGQWHRALAVDGFLMFSCLGPDTLQELRRVYAALGWPPPGHAFTDMHDWGDMLVHAGFAEPIMDMERIRLTYDSPARLLADLRELGRNLHPDRHPVPRGRAWRARLESALAQALSDPAEQGRLALTFEIIYGHAFRPAPRVPMTGESSVSLQDMRSLLRRGPADRG